MITVISATNRQDSMTRRVASLYHKLLSARHDDVHLISLEGLNVWERNSADLLKLQEQHLIPSEKFAFIMPEYNGSFPGILKLMIDNSDIRRCWWHKKAMLTGVADGRAGNLRGMEHMTNILHYMRMHVFWDKLPISRINEEIDNDGRLLKPATEQAIQEQINAFLKF